MLSAGLVFVGAGAGGVARWLVNLACLAWFGAGFPLGTMVVNVVGSLVMGVGAAWVLARGGAVAEQVRLLGMTGFLGGFTTFSAFSFDAVALWERGETGLSAFYVVASVGLSIAALAAGLALARSLI